MTKDVGESAFLHARRLDLLNVSFLLPALGLREFTGIYMHSLAVSNKLSALNAD